MLVNIDNYKAKYGQKWYIGVKQGQIKPNFGK